MPHGGLFVTVPREVARAAAVAHGARVRGTVNGARYRSSLMKYSGVFHLGVHQATLRAAQVKVGDRVDITWLTDVTVAVLSEAPSAAPPAMAGGVSRLVLEAPTTSTQNKEFMIVAEVRDSGGQPVNGVPVEFSVEPEWQKNVSFTPQRPVTEDNGDAVTLVVPNMTGIVHITARAGDKEMTTRVTVTGAGSTGPGR